MKFLRPSFLCLLLLPASSALGSASLTNAPTGNVRLAWSSTNEVSTNFSFSIYASTNLATTFEQWPLLTNILSTDALGTNSGGTNFYADLNLAPAQYFFVATASNFWGESSITSNICNTPPPPQPINNSLKIKKLP